jgi:uncharacterized repeat protein (TIGR03803 family)
MRTRGFGNVLCINVGAALVAGCSVLGQAQNDTQPALGAAGTMPQTALVAPAQARVRAVFSMPFKVLHRFSGGSDGATPDADLIDVNGTLYGTTSHGGVLNCPGGCGTVYGISTTGAEKVLYDFTGGSDGAYPTAGLVNVKGRLYGTTTAGGGAPCPLGGCGTVYTVSTSGKEKVLYRFTGRSDGAYPEASLIEVKHALYGTTSTGGSSGVGTVYGISTSGTEKTLYSFAGGSDGAGPLAQLIDVKDTLYGTTANGGDSGCAGGCGTVYSISTSGKEKVLYSFGGVPDGASPQAALIEVSGRLYGTTSSGGGSGCYGYGCGTVYNVTTAGAETVLYRFKSGSDGSQPAASLINVKGTMYGTTVDGGVSRCNGGGCGTIYSISTTGEEKVLHRFSGGSDGAAPQAGLIRVKDALYGTTSAGGLRCYRKLSCGIVFAL